MQVRQITTTRNCIHYCFHCPACVRVCSCMCAFVYAYYVCTYVCSFMCVHVCCACVCVCVCVCVCCVCVQACKCTCVPATNLATFTRWSSFSVLGLIPCRSSVSELATRLWLCELCRRCARNSSSLASVERRSFRVQRVARVSSIFSVMARGSNMADMVATPSSKIASNCKQEVNFCVYYLVTQMSELCVHSPQVFK